MELIQDSSKLRTLSTSMSRNLSSSSSAFVSASQSPFFSPRSPSLQGPESTRYEIPYSSNTPFLIADTLSSTTATKTQKSLSIGQVASENSLPARGGSNEGGFSRSSAHDQVSTSTANCKSNSSSCIQGDDIAQFWNKERPKKWGRNHGRFQFGQSSTSLSYNRQRSFDVYIGFHGRKPSLLRFTKWLRAELEMQGISCFPADRAQCRSSRSSSTVERAMNVSTFGVVILSRKSFGNRYSIMEIRNFLARKNLVPVFFDLGPGDCLARDIIEKRGEMWEKHGGDLWMLYDGLEMEWKEAVNGLSRVDEWKLEAQDGNWRDCILKVVVLLATKLGRRSVVDRVNIWKERADREEFPFPRNENFIGRKKELSELELILFGDVSGDAETEYFELKTRHRRKNLVTNRTNINKKEDKFLEQQIVRNTKGKEPVMWKESEKEIEMQNVESPQRRSKDGGKHRRRKRSMKIVYGKGVACVSGDSGIGKTDLLLEFAYRFSQRYKMVLWIGGETRYIRQNYLNLSPFLDVDVGIENRWLEKRKTKSFDEQESAAIHKVRKELMRDIPFLVIIDNLEAEKDWWDQKTVMDLLPRFGGETHIIISTRLPRIMNLEPLKLSYLSGVEAMSLMKGIKEYPITEIDALKVIEEKLGRLTLGLGIVGAILSELPINPTRLLDIVNRMPLRDLRLSRRDDSTLSQQAFLIQLLEVCFSIFDQADGPRNLATRMVQVCGYFGPSSIPVSLLSLAANRVPEKHQNAHIWKKCLNTLTCGFSRSDTKRSESEASSMLVRFGIARNGISEDFIHFHEIIKLYARKRELSGVTYATVEAISVRGFVDQDLDHLWAACFLLFGFGTNQPTIQLKVPDLLLFVKRVILPLAIRTFMTYSRCNAALELLRLCTDALEAAEESLVTRVEKWLDKPLCWRPVQTNAQLNPLLWQELALTRATIVETRAKLMLKGGNYDIGDDLIRKALFIRTSICGEDHPDTISTRETLNKLMRHMTNSELT